MSSPSSGAKLLQHKAIPSVWRHGGLQGGGLQKCRAGIEVPGKKVPWAINPQLKPQEHVRIPTIGEEDARFFDELREGPETRGARNDGHGDIGVKVPRLQVEQGLCLLFAGTHTKDGNLGECTWALQHDVADYIRLHYSHYSRDRTLQCFFCCCTQLSAAAPIISFNSCDIRCWVSVAVSLFLFSPCSK